MKNQSVILEYILKNKRTFILIICLFFIGMIIGIFFVNNANYNEKEEIMSYVNDLTQNVKKIEKIDTGKLLYQSFKENALFVLLIWFLGCTIVGSLLIYLAIVYKGILLGYTISAIIATLNIKSGCIFIMSSLLLQNIFLLPSIFLISESGLKLYNGICKHCINLKVDVLRHSVIMLISILLAVIASFVEVYMSTNLLIFLKDFL